MEFRGHGIPCHESLRKGNSVPLNSEERNSVDFVFREKFRGIPCQPSPLREKNTHLQSSKVFIYINKIFNLYKYFLAYQELGNEEGRETIRFSVQDILGR